MVVLGLAEPDRLWRKSGARAGDAIVLGKALGTGIITTGLKRGVADGEPVAAAIRSMRQLNRQAADILAEHAVHAATDVTGYGLLGHLAEVCRSSGVRAQIASSAPALLPGAHELARQGVWPDGTERNRDAVEAFVTWADAVTDTYRVILSDAQTSGGLLVFLPEAEADAAVAALQESGYEATRIGVIEDGDPHIKVEE